MSIKVKILVLFIIHLNSHELSLVSKFKNKNDLDQSQSYDTSVSFSSLNFLTSTPNLSYLKCISLCFSYACCFSLINNKYNSTYSLCSLYNNYPSALAGDLVLSQVKYMQQKIFFRKSKYFKIQ